MSVDLTCRGSSGLFMSSSVKRAWVDIVQILRRDAETDRRDGPDHGGGRRARRVSTRIIVEKTESSSRRVAKTKLQNEKRCSFPLRNTRGGADSAADLRRYL